MRIADRRQWTVVAIDHGAGETATVTMEELVPRYGLGIDMIRMTFPASKVPLMAGEMVWITLETQD